MNKRCLTLGLMFLVACGTGDIATTQSSQYPEPLGFVTVTSPARLSTREPLPAQVNISGTVMIDGAQDRHPDRFTLTTAETVTITILHHPVKFAREKYSLRYDPSLWVRLVDGKEMPFEDSIGPYPEDGWILKPLQPGSSVLRFWIYQDDPAVFAGCASDNAYKQSYNFDVQLP